MLMMGNSPDDSEGLSKGGLALTYAALGWPVIPLYPKSKIRHSPPGTEPSTDLDQVLAWWRRWPRAEIGLVITSLHVVVLDADGPAGDRSLRSLLDRAGVVDLPVGPVVTTGREEGGHHYLLRLPTDVAKPRTQNGSNYPDTPGLDVLTNNLFVAPGSTHRSGRTYTSSVPLPSPTDLPLCPRSLVDVIVGRAISSHPRPKAGKPSASSGSGRVRDDESEGEADDRLLGPRVGNP